MNSVFSVISHQAWVRCRLGQLEAAAAAMVPQIAQAQAAGNPTFVAAQLFYFHDALIDRSGLDEIVHVAETLDPRVAGLEGTLMEAMLRVVRGRLRASRVDRRGAEEDLRRAHAITQELSMSPAVIPTGSLLALVLPPGSREEAGALVATELAAARRAGQTRAVGIALRAAGTLSEDAARGVEELRESVRLLASCGARLEQARSMLALGSALRRDGARVEARTELVRASELAQACGADLLVGRIQEELRAAGGRPRRTATSGPDALTASELRVARRAAAGASTPEIAQALVVSAKTVETHLTHAYAKLGLSGPGARERLAEALGPG
jgi:DNA-binding CsgD family transcriptional regulator